MTVKLCRLNLVPLAGARQPTEADIPALGALMLDAYRDTVDYEGETLEQAIAEVTRTFAGKYGLFLPQCSCVVERAGELVSAALLTRWQERPFVAFAMTAQGCKRQGLARACMLCVMEAVRESGEEKLSLVVTVANVAAYELYQSLGFVPGR